MMQQIEMSNAEYLNVRIWYRYGIFVLASFA